MDYDAITKIFAALNFAAEKHRLQRRKGASETPYINHPIAAAELLWRVGGVRDAEVLVAAILHDTVEDTDTTPEELAVAFGPRVRALVVEVTDDKSLPKPERKRLQVEGAPHLSPGAKLIRLADKALNVHDVAYSRPTHWPHQRCVDYLEWTERVVAGMRGTNAGLESYYDAVLAEARAKVLKDGVGAGEHGVDPAAQTPKPVGG